ncbi:homeobox-leucine zipper protein ANTHOCYANINLESS 2-like [Dorcoceras hygrometricum]|uniref:Homeobox-leucine zipper protein ANTHOCYANINLESS 2-like n=1 Tax=Dorcoceras hygrometricum TaxID=472368 RepID=A0A2Z7AY04_9LAMI|nr:homeobox-leucine zipper protein ANTHOCYANINLESS 2-like [Dorcoceras hygrometricum]
MNFGDFLDNNSCGGGGARIGANIPYSDSSTTIKTITLMSNINSMPTGAIAQPRLLSQSLAAKPIFNSSGLSLALETGAGAGQGEVARMGETFEFGNVGGRKMRDEEHESRSGSDNMDGASGDEQDAADKPSRKKRYHRHTPQQIQELEGLFKECPHPDEKQRMELSKRLCLDSRQVKFWFQNRRTQMKTQLERHENSLLRQENDKLRTENMSIREAMRNPMCTNCGGPAIIGDISLEEQHLRIENARLKDELDRVCVLAGKFLGRPISSMTVSMVPPMPNSSLELGVGNNGFGILNAMPSSLPLAPPDFCVGISNSLPLVPPAKATMNVAPIERSLERSMYLELALAAMDELVKMAQSDEPLWVRTLEGGREVLNHEEYLRTFTPCIGMKPIGFVSEASRETGLVIINSLALVETLMDSNKWAEMFPCIVARTTTLDVISNGMGGTRNGALHLMQAEIQVLSPLVPVREVNFLRFCKQHAEGVWAVVDVSIDTTGENSGGLPTIQNCRRLPSGCVVQDMPNGYSKVSVFECDTGISILPQKKFKNNVTEAKSVTWVEHTEYDESVIHHLYRPFISEGLGFGSQRWVAALQRQCECLAILMSSADSSRDQAAAISGGGRRSMLKLAQRMTTNFCAGVCASTVHKWNKLRTDSVGEDVRVMTRRSIDDPGEPSGIVLSASTSVWLPVSPHRVFDFLRNVSLRCEWDILSHGGPMQEMAHIAKGQDQGNCVSLLRASAINADQSNMLILQETCIDAAGSLVVYAPVDNPAMHVVLNGGDPAYVALLPSGFAIVADGPDSKDSPARRVNGSLLTVAFQILVNSLPSSKLTLESVETVNNLISCTVQKIKSALQCET